jgi:hypothetical protein
VSVSASRSGRFAPDDGEPRYLLGKGPSLTQNRPWRHGKERNLYCCRESNPCIVVTILTELSRTKYRAVSRGQSDAWRQHYQWCVSATGRCCFRALCCKATDRCVELTSAASINVNKSATPLNPLFKIWNQFWLGRYDSRDRLGGLVVRDSIPREVLSLERGPLSLWVQMSCLEKKVAAPAYKTENRAVGNLRADHATPSVHENWH